MAYNQYQYDKEKFDKLPFLGGLFKYLYLTSSRAKCVGELFELTEEDYRKAKARLVGEMDGEIVSGDKVYLFPQSSIPLFKLKEHLKAVGAKFTADIFAATKMIGHINVSCSNDQHTNSSFLRSFAAVHMLNDLKYYDVPTWQWSVEEKKMDSVQEIVEKRIENNVWASKVVEGERTYTGTILSDYLLRELRINHRNYKIFHAITPTGALVLYHILDKKIPVISEDQIFKSIGKPMVIDKETYVSIKEMMDSSDGSQHKIAAEILANSDIEKSWFHMWLVARNFYWKITDFKTLKNIGLFIEKARLRELCLLNAEDMVSFLKLKDQLTEETFLHLAGQAVKDFENKYQSAVFKLTLVPSEEYTDVSNGAEFAIHAEGKVKPVADTDDIEEEDDDDDDI